MFQSEIFFKCIYAKCQTWYVAIFLKKSKKIFSHLFIHIQYGDREAQELWSHLQLKIPQYFKDIEVKPSLLHGDLWSGNAAETSECPGIYKIFLLFFPSEIKSISVWPLRHCNKTSVWFVKWSIFIQLLVILLMWWVNRL